MLSSSKTRKSSSKISRLGRVDPMGDHEASSFFTKFNTKLIADEFKSSCKFHRWANKAKFQADISNLNPSEILDLPLSYFGLCNISSINQFMDELDISPAKKNVVNELFKIKYATKMYPDDVNEEAMLLISKTKLYKIKKQGQIKADKDEKWGDYWGERYRLAELGISTDPSATATVEAVDESPELSNLEARLARLKDPNAKGLKSKKRRGIKRRRTKRRGTKQRQQGVKRRRSKSRR